MPCALAQQPASESVELRGKVLNSVTGEPVAGALVQIYGQEQRAQFTAFDGTFVFNDLPPGSYSPVARKQGFFSNRQVSIPMRQLIQASESEPLILKLTPEAIIFGEVKNENGRPLEGVIVRAQQWQTQNGQKQLATLGNAVTDDEGNFRLADLSQGHYYLSFLSTNRGSWITTYQLSSKKQDEQGYGAQFYPGVRDVKSATAIEIRPGAQIHIVQALSPERLFAVAGVVHGADSETPVNLMLMNTSGDFVQKSVSINPKTGQFQIRGVPAGPYMLRVTANRRPALRNTASGLLAPADEERPPPTAALPLQVHDDLSGLVVVLGTGTSIGVQLRDETSGSIQANGLHQVLLKMTPQEFSGFQTAIMVPPSPGDRRASTRFEGLAPDAYTVEAIPRGPWYISSLRCGSEDLLRDDLTVSGGGALPPIEVTLRDDGAQLTVKVVNNGQPVEAGVLLFSPDYPRRSQFFGSSSSISVGNLAPGRYYIIAASGAGNLEFRNPLVMEPYLAHATEVTLGPRANVTVSAEVQEREDEKQ
ncbi:MAG TPA: carboxypeptidase-like regulatory domain-containing protein [Candidatus Acidoferrum sp.]|nr:carboxypeptidase-like regulatory domain-containing protein [Candidatus Acidoferrum sp.]